MFRDAGDHVRIQPLGFGAITEMENACLVAHFDVGFSAAASYQGESSENEP